MEGRAIFKEKTIPSNWVYKYIMYINMIYYDMTSLIQPKQRFGCLYHCSGVEKSLLHSNRKLWQMGPKTDFDM